MIETALPNNAALVGGLDPTYTLKRGIHTISPYQLPGYLRLHHLFVGPLVIPRTYLIHGTQNPFIDLFLLNKEGEREIEDLLKSGAAFVTGHSNPKFLKIHDHLSVTHRERHPMVRHYDQRLPVAQAFDELIPTRQIVTVPQSKVIKTYRTLFLNEFSTMPGITEEMCHRIDRFAWNRMKYRNQFNEISYDEWGRNEVCDYIIEQASSMEAKTLAECAVSSYQRIFSTNVEGGTQVLARSILTPANPKGAEDRLRKMDLLPKDLVINQHSLKAWEIDYEAFQSRPWEEIVDQYQDNDWQNLLTNYRSALAAADRTEASSTLEKMFAILHSKFRPKNGKVRATLEWFSNNIWLMVVIEILSKAFPDPAPLAIVGSHGSLLLAAQCNAQLRKARQRRDLKTHLNYLLPPYTKDET